MTSLLYILPPSTQYFWILLKLYNKSWHQHMGMLPKNLSLGSPLAWIFNVAQKATDYCQHIRQILLILVNWCLFQVVRRLWYHWDCFGPLLNALRKRDNSIACYPKSKKLKFYLRYIQGKLRMIFFFFFVLKPLHITLLEE